MSLDRRKKSRPKRVKGRGPVVAVDLFAGAGGFSAAAKAIGVEVRLAIELNNHACDTYRHNLVESNGCGPTLLEGDITKMSSRHLFLDHFRHGQECDMLLGGPPCQGFSVHRIKGAGVDDPRNELIHTYFEFVKTFRPKIFLMENVPGMLWPRHKDYIDNFYKTGRRAKYHLVEPVILDARDYGVPQRRKRVFILGVRNDLDLGGLVWPPAPSHGDDQKRQQNPNLKKWVAARDVFRSAPKNDENNRHMNHSDELVDAFKSTPANGGSRKDSGRVLECHKGHNGHKDVYGRIDPSVPGPTMTTACINPSKGRFVHPTQHHGITLRQAARFQTFPDNFIFKGGLIASGEQIGNAVPVELGKVLLSHLSKFISDR